MFKEVIPTLHVTNAKASKAFYTDKLGFSLDFEVRTSDDGSDPMYFGVSRDNAELHLSSHAGDSICGAAVYFRVENVDQLYEEFTSRAVPIHIHPVDQTWGMREMYVKDPDGNSLRFGHPVRK